MGLKQRAKSGRIRVEIAGVLVITGALLALLGLRRHRAKHWSREDRKAAARATSRQFTRQLREEIVNGRK